MSRNVLIANRLREVFLNGHWIANTNFKEQIQELDWKHATRKVLNLNTIAALTFHVNYYLDGLLRAFASGKLEISDKYSFDLPVITNESDWSQLRNALIENAEEFAKRVEQMPDHQFDEPFIDVKYGTYLRNIEAVIEHSYYHLGQVSLIKKMIIKT